VNNKQQQHKPLEQVLGLTAAFALGAVLTAAPAKADLTADLLARSEANKAVNDKKRLLTSSANVARSRTVTDGTCGCVFGGGGGQWWMDLRPRWHTKCFCLLALTFIGPEKTSLFNLEIQPPPPQTHQILKPNSFPTNFFGCDETSAKLTGGVRFIQDDVDAECAGAEKGRCASRPNMNFGAKGF
jgi:hypothetical protein